jgi:hypothetical protein
MGKKATLEIHRGKQTISYEITVSEKQDLQERLANRVTREQAKIPKFRNSEYWLLRSTRNLCRCFLRCAIDSELWLQVKFQSFDRCGLCFWKRLLGVIAAYCQSPNKAYVSAKPE